MSDELRFEMGERAKIDAIVDGFREHLEQDDQWERVVGFPFVQHHRWARKVLRTASGRRGVTVGEIAQLMLEWSRHCGDVRYYAVQPFAQWGLQCVADGKSVHDSLNQAMRIVKGAKIGFIDFAADRLKTMRVSAAGKIQTDEKV